MHFNLHRQFPIFLCIALYFVVSVIHVSGFTYGACEVLPYRGEIHFFCYRKNIDQVPQKLPLDLTHIDISENRIKKIRSGDFQNLTYLRKLNISCNSISYVGKGAFRDLISLTDLDLSHNTLTIITKDLFHGLTNLLGLSLKENKISTIEESSFSSFQHLVNVTLTSNMLTDMKSMQSIFRIKSLKEIQIGYNKINVFQSIDISNSSLTLKILNLAHNTLNVFRISADIFPKLETIDLSYCFSNKNVEWDVKNTSFFKAVKRLDLAGISVSVVKFNAILKTFSHSLAMVTLNRVYPVKSLINSTCLIPTILSLTLRDNNIRSLEGTGLEKCFQIKALDLYHNNLFDLERVFAALKNLTSLQLGYNRFSSIPSIMQNLSSLESVNFVFNQIERLECSTFTNLSNLETVQLFGNVINVVKRCVFRDLVNLRNLYLGSNCIKFLHGAFINGPGKLEVLDLNSNSLVSITKDDFRGLKSLQSLFLNDNKIKVIQNEAFSELINLKSLVLESNKVADNSLRQNVFSGLSNLTILSLQNNYILRTKTSKSPPFYHLKSLKWLYVFSQRNHKKTSYLPSNFLWNLTCLISFWANNVGLTSLPEDLFKDNAQLTELALSGNALIELSPKLFLPLSNLSLLYLKETHLKTLDFLLQANLVTLSFLQVSNNQITSINDTILKSLPQLTIIDMKGSTFACDCSNAWFIKWVEEGNVTQVLGADKFECYSPPDLRQTKLLHVDVHSCSVDIEFFCYISSMSLVLLTLVSSLVYHFLHWQIVYAYYFLLAFLYDNKRKESNKQFGFQYDAFVSYNTLDELWVTNELLPKLEGEQGWKLCLHHRDFLPGKPIVDNIVDGIYSSRKTICVISQHYLESEWCSREVQVASFRLFDEKKDVLILVFLEDIPVYRLSPYYRMRALVKKRTYLSWPKAGQDTRAFWEKFRGALGTRRDSEEENALSRVLHSVKK